jgi:hypothetical protein
MKRAAREARKQGHLIDLTFGNACQSVVFFDSGHVALAAADCSRWLLSRRRMTHGRWGLGCWVVRRLDSCKLDVVRRLGRCFCS